MAEHAAKGSSGEVRPEGTAPAAHTPAVWHTGRATPAPTGSKQPSRRRWLPRCHYRGRNGYGRGGSTRPRAGGPGGALLTAQSKRWELIIAISIALVTVTGAVLTYLSIQQESAAVEADRQSVVETLQVQNQVVAAATQARAYGVLAVRYRQLMAEVSVLAATDPDQAAMLRADATGVNLNGVTDYTTGTGAAAQYNFAAALQGALTVLQSSTIPPDQPAPPPRSPSITGRLPGGLPCASWACRASWCCSRSPGWSRQNGSSGAWSASRPLVTWPPRSPASSGSRNAVARLAAAAMTWGGSHVSAGTRA